MNYILTIKRLLKEKNITQREFSDKIGVSLTTTNSYLTEKTKIDVDTLIKIAKELNVTASYLLDERTIRQETKDIVYKVLSHRYNTVIKRTVRQSDLIAEISQKLTFSELKTENKNIIDRIYSDLITYPVDELSETELDKLRDAGLISRNYHKITKFIKKYEDDISEYVPKQ